MADYKPDNEIQDGNKALLKRREWSRVKTDQRSSRGQVFYGAIKVVRH
jgi:hypothetical protein